jgi:hypothetical protein
MCLGYEPPEVRIHLRSASCDVKSLYFCFFKYIKALLHRFAMHDLLAVGTGVHMAMFASLVAHVSHIHLKYLNTRRPKRVVPQGFYFFFERDALSGTRDNVLQDVNLPLMICQGMISCV